MKIKFLSLVVLTALFVTGCFTPDVPDLPDADDIEAQVEAALNDAGIDMPDLNEVNFDESEYDGPALKIPTAEKKGDKRSGTAGAVYSDVETFARESFPKAVLIAYNNQGPDFSNSYLVPTRNRLTSGEGDYWAYFFVKDSESFSDGFVSDVGEAFVVEFSAGNMSFSNASIFADEVAENELTGADWFKTDTDVIYANSVAAILADFGVDKFIHVNFDCTPVWPTTFASGNGDCTLTFYETNDAGYEVGVYASNGEVQSVESVEFVDIF